MNDAEREETFDQQEFLSSIAHDIRSPLGTVRQAVEIMLEGVDGPLNEKQRERLCVALRNISRIEIITSEMKERSLKYREERCR